MPWYATLEELLTLGDPRVERRDYGTRSVVDIWWSEDEVLNGLEATVSGTLVLPDEPALLSLLCHPPAQLYFGDPLAGLEPELSRLTALFGAGRSTGEGYAWRLDDVELRLEFSGLNEMHYAEDWAKRIRLTHRVTL